MKTWRGTNQKSGIEQMLSEFLKINGMGSPTKCFKILVDLVLRFGKLIELREFIALGNDFHFSPRKEEMEELPTK